MVDTEKTPEVTLTIRRNPIPGEEETSSGFLEAHPDIAEALRTAPRDIAQRPPFGEGKTSPLSPPSSMTKP